MDREEADAAGRGGRGDRDADRRPALAGAAEDADRGPPGHGRTTPTDWVAAVAEEANRLADESGDLHLRVAVRAAGAYAYLCAGDFDGFERTPDEVLELTGDDPGVGAGIVIGSPVAWAADGQGRWRCASEASSRRPRSCSRRRCGSPTEEGDPETDELDPRQRIALMLAMRGETRRRGDGAAQLRADRAARRRLLAQPRPGQPRGYAQLAAEEYAGRAGGDRGGRAALPRGDGRRRRDGGLARHPAGRGADSASAGPRRRSSWPRGRRRSPASAACSGRCRWRCTSSPRPVPRPARTAPARRSTRRRRLAERHRRACSSLEAIEAAPRRDRGRARRSPADEVHLWPRSEWAQRRAASRADQRPVARVERLGRRRGSGITCLSARLDPGVERRPGSGSRGRRRARARARSCRATFSGGMPRAPVFLTTSR